MKYLIFCILLATISSIHAQTVQPLQDPSDFIEAFKEAVLSENEQLLKPLYFSRKDVDNARALLRKVVNPELRKRADKVAEEIDRVADNFEEFHSDYKKDMSKSWERLMQYDEKNGFTWARVQHVFTKYEIQKRDLLSMRLELQYLFLTEEGKELILYAQARQLADAWRISELRAEIEQAKEKTEEYMEEEYAEEAMEEEGDK